MKAEVAFFVLTNMNYPSIYSSALTGQRSAPPSFGVDIPHNDQSGYDELCQQIGTMSEQLWDSGGKVDCSPWWTVIDVSFIQLIVFI